MTRPAARSRKTRKPRRTNAQRTAQTRAVIIEAAIEILFTRGHAATTTIAVAARARVSRGAMLHHFPTRVDLLIAVAEYIVNMQREMRRARSNETPAGPQRYYAGADINWEIQKQPATIALLEIMMATRGDAQLRKGFAPFIKQMREMRARAADLVSADLGVQDKNTVTTMLYLHQATLRGLAIHLLSTGDERAVEDARLLFKRCSHAFADALMAAEERS